MTRISGVFRDIKGFAREYPTKTVEAEDDLGRFSGINVPIFLIWGDRDYYFPVDIATELFLALPDARLWIIPQQGHTPLWKFMGGDDRASETFPMVAREFLDQDPGKITK